MVLAFIILSTLSHLVYHRSVFASFLEIYLRCQHKIGYRLPDREAVMRKVNANDGLCRAVLPKRMSAPVRETEESGLQTFILNEDTDSKVLVFFLSGGGFLHPPRGIVFRFIDRVAASTGAKMIVPVYRRLPQCTFRDTYPQIVDMYKSEVEKHPGWKIVLAGDSAGANIALVISQFLIRDGYRQPDDIIISSPPAGYPYAGHEEEFAPYDRVDPFLNAVGVNTLAEAWAGDGDVLDWRVSPYLGDVRGMGRTTIFVGGREVFCPSANAIYRKMVENGVDAQIIVGRNLNHDFPLHPIPDAWPYRRMFCEIVKRPAGEQVPDV